MINRILRKTIVRISETVVMLCLLLPAMSLQAMAASKISVSGTVTSQIEDEPLAGASVRIKGTSLGVTTDVDGKYEILAEKGQVLQFSYIGYKSKEVTIDRNVINVALDEDRTLLDDVVVVGYGTMKRSDITGSVVSVGADEIKKTIVTSVDQALQGRAAGVQVTQNSGSPGGGISVAIRGVNSLNGNEPLYVIDGVAVDGKSSDGKTSALSSQPLRHHVHRGSQGCIRHSHLWLAGIQRCGAHHHPAWTGRQDSCYLRGILCAAADSEAVEDHEPPPVRTAL